MTRTERILYADGTTPPDHGVDRMVSDLNPQQREAMARGISGHTATSRALWRRWLIERMPRWAEERGCFEDLELTPFGHEVRDRLRRDRGL